MQNHLKPATSLAYDLRTVPTSDFPCFSFLAFLILIIRKALFSGAGLFLSAHFLRPAQAAATGHQIFENQRAGSKFESPLRELNHVVKIDNTTPPWLTLVE